MVSASQAEERFRALADRLSLTIERRDDPNVELLMLMPEQPGLAFGITIALQDEDVVSIGLDEFVAYFPIGAEPDLAPVCEAVEGLVAGACRVAVHSQRGRITKRVLECLRDGTWTTRYTHFSGMRLPFLGVTVAHIRNGAARS